MPYIVFFPIKIELRLVETNYIAEKVVWDPWEWSLSTGVRFREVVAWAGSTVLRVTY